MSDRQRRVRAAIDELTQALGTFGANYLRHVEAWAAGLEPSASTLAGFSSAVKMAASRLPNTPPSVREAHCAFVRSIEAVRHETRIVASQKPHRLPAGSVLGGGVRAAPWVLQATRAV